MEELGRRRLRNAGVALAAVTYFFAFARPLPREIVLAPAWARPVGAASPQAPAGRGGPAEEPLPFRFGRRFGYFTPEGRVLSSAEAPYGVSLSSLSWTAYDRVPERLELRSPAGDPLGSIDEPGYPFHDGERLYVLSPGQTGAAALAPDGKTLWRRDFASIVTAFDSSPSLAVFGLLDGSLVGLDGKGTETLSFAPGGSRLPGVYGCAVSPDGSRVAAVTGLDPQRLLLLERRSSAYRVAWHRDLGSDYRRPVAISFTEDGGHLVFQRPGGAGILDLDGFGERFLPGGGFSAHGLSLPELDLLVLLEDGASQALVLALPSGARVATASFAGRDSFALRGEGSLFIGFGERGSDEATILRLDVRED